MGGRPSGWTAIEEAQLKQRYVDLARASGKVLKGGSMRMLAREFSRTEGEIKSKLDALRRSRRLPDVSELHER